MTDPFPREDGREIAKNTLATIKILLRRTTGPIATKSDKEIYWAECIQICAKDSILFSK